MRTGRGKGKRKTREKKQKENKFQEKERLRVEENEKITKMKKEMKKTVENSDNKVTLKEIYVSTSIALTKVARVLKQK